MNWDDREHIGLIAQEVEKVVPEIVTTDENGFKSLAYGRITPLLVESVKYLKEENDNIKLELASLWEKIEEIKEL